MSDKDIFLGHVGVGLWLLTAPRSMDSRFNAGNIKTDSVWRKVESGLCQGKPKVVKNDMFETRDFL